MNVEREEVLKEYRGDRQHLFTIWGCLHKLDGTAVSFGEWLGHFLQEISDITQKLSKFSLLLLRD